MSRYSAPCLLLCAVATASCSRDLQTIPTADDATCSDGVQNGTESDVDCGGNCTACPDFSTCAVGADCQSLACFSLTCFPPSCFDEIRNGTETDTDCGAGCDPCADNLACNLDSDCASQACDPDLKTCIELTEEDFIIQDATEFADLAGVQILAGNLTISLPVMESTLPTLELREVRGNVTIFANQGLVDLGDPFGVSNAGLSSLERIQGNLVIRFNESLTDLSALQGLTQVGSVRISDNSALEHLGGLESLTVVTDLVISYNDSLLSLEGTIPDSTGLAGLTQITGNLEISNNFELIGLEGLDGVSVVRGDLNISFNENLQFIDGLYSINSVGGELTLLANSNLSAIGDAITPAFPLLANVGGTLSIESNFILQQVLGFDALLQAGGLKVEDHESLQFVQGFDSMILLEGSLVFSDNFSLSSVPDFISLNVVLGDFWFLRNDALMTLNGFGSLFVVAGNQGGTDDFVFWIASNPVLTSVNGLVSLDGLVGNLNISDNPMLTAFNGLENVPDPDSVRISGNAISSLSIGAFLVLGDLTIAEPSLNALSLANLLEVESSLVISGGVMDTIALPSLEFICQFPTATPMMTQCGTSPGSDFEGCTLTIENTPASTISIPSLEDTNTPVSFGTENCIYLGGNLLVTDLNLGSLTSLYAMNLSNVGRNAANTSIDLSSLDTLTSFEIHGGRAPSSMTFSISDGGDLFWINDVADLSAIIFSNAPEFGTFLVTDNAELDSLTVQAGSTVRDTQNSMVLNNECLDPAEAAAVETVLCSGSCSNFSSASNGMAAVFPCP